MKEHKFVYMGAFIGEDKNKQYEKVVKGNYRINEFRGRLGLLLGKKGDKWNEDVLSLT